MTSHACVVFVESNTSGTGRLFVRAARELGYQPLLLARDPGRYPYVEDDAVPFRIVDARRRHALKRAVRDLPVAAVLSSSEYFLDGAAQLARDLGLCGPDPMAVRRCRNKWRQRQAFRGAGLPVPACLRAQAPWQAARAAARIGFPVVVKPLDGTGSIGVRFCRTPAEVGRHAAALLARGHNERGLPVAGNVLVEEYIDGPEYSVETFGDAVIGVVRKHLSKRPFFVEVGHDYPARVPAATETVLADAARASLRAVGLGWGPAHVEVRMRATGPVVIEVNARLAGGFIPELVRHAQRIDLIAQTVRAAVGETPDLRPAAHGRAAIRFIVATRSGRITAVNGHDAARQSPGIVDVQLYRSVGDRVEVQHDFRDRAGHVIARDLNGQAAGQLAVQARDRIRLAIAHEPRTPQPPVVASTSSVHTWTTRAE